MLKIQKLSEDGNGLIKNVQGKIGKPLDTKGYRNISSMHHYHVIIFDTVRKTNNNDKVIYV